MLNRFRRWFRHVGLLSKFFSVQLGVQALGFVVGILVVRGLDKPDYALYAVGTSVMAALVALSEGGVTSVLSSEGAKVREDRRRLGFWVWESLRARRLLALVISCVGVLLLVVLMFRNGASWPVVALSTVIVVASLWPALDRGVYQVPLRLNRDYVWNQTASMTGAALRLVAVGGLVALGWLSVLSALMIMFAGMLLEMLLVRHRSKRYAQVSRPTVEFSNETRPLFRLTMRMVLPASVFMVLQGQLYLITLSFMSSPDIIAELTALSRFSIIYVIISAFYLDVVSGKISRYDGHSKAVASRIVVSLAAYAAVVVAVVVGLYLFSPLLIALLGADYAGLNVALTIVGAGGGLIALGRAWKILNQARNWVAGSWSFIPLTALWLAWGVLFVDLTQLNQAAFWMAAQAIPTLGSQLVCTLLGIRRPDQSPEHVPITPTQ